MLVVLTETYCNKVNIHITQRDDFIQTRCVVIMMYTVYVTEGVNVETLSKHGLENLGVRRG